MTENVTVILWLVLLGAIAVPILWMIWIFIKRAKANENITGTPSERGEAAPEDETTQQ